MKKKRYFLCVVASVLALSSCSFLDFDETTGKERDEVYSYFENMMSLCNAVYRNLPMDWGVIGGALRESATDNSVYTWDSNAIYDIYNDKWSPINTIDDQWGAMYTVIHDANAFLNDYSEEALKRLEWDASYEDNLNKLRMMKNEVRALRALYYFELVKRYHEVPLVTEVVSPEDVNSLPKATFTQVLDFIVSECTEVAPLLPVDHADFYQETGRVTKGAALAIKARALLYAASPLYVEGDPAAAWEKAARASAEIINMGVYSMPKISSDPLYDANGGDVTFTSPQMIFERRNGSPSNSFEGENLPIGFADGTNSGNTPTQNFVDAFEMKDGTVFDWGNPDHVANIYYDANGNQTRDPRLYLNVICNGMTYMNQVVDTYIGGRYGEPVTGATKTGYYLKKLMNETISLDPVHPITKNHHYPAYRYAEVLLSYAEAMNEWMGPKYADPEICSLTATDALNMVRDAADMPAVDIADKDAFREKVRNERRIELAFEDHRFWDIRRWKIGNVVENIYGIKIRRSGDTYTYSKEIVQERIWKDKMYWYPIPASESYKNPALGQNPGWN